MHDNASSNAPSAMGATLWWSGTRGRIKAAVTATLLLLASYAAVGYLLAPAAVERGLIRTAAQATGSVLSIGQLRVNPFRLGVVLDDVRLEDPDAAAMLTVQRLAYRLRLRGLLGGQRMLETLVLEQPQMTLPAGGAPKESMPTRWLAALIDAESFHIEQLRITDGEIRMHPRAEGVQHGEVYAGIALTVRSLDSGVAAAPAHYRLAVEQAYGARLAFEGEVRLRSARSGRPAVEVLPSRGELHALRLPVLPGVSLIAPVVEVEAFVGTLRLPGARPQAAARLHIAQAVLQESDSVAVAFSQLDGAFDLDGSAQGGAEFQLQGLSDISERFSLSGRYAAIGASPSVALTLHDVKPEPLSLMLEAAIGHGVDAGLATIDLHAQRDAHGRLSKAMLEVAASNLVLAKTPQEASSNRGLDAALLLALLEDPRGDIRLEVPVEFMSATPASSAITQTIRRYAHESVASPAVALGRTLALPGPPPLSVAFEPGAAALTPVAAQALSELAGVLLMRPRLGLAVPAPIDLQLDRDALARQQIELHVTLATAGAEFRGRRRPVDFASARAQDVLDEFAAERLPTRELAAIAAQHERTGQPQDRAPYYRAVFAALVDSERIERSALERIGRFRARSVADALTGLGMPPASVAVAEDVTAVTSDAGQLTVPVELQLRARSAQQQ